MAFAAAHQKIFGAMLMDASCFVDNCAVILLNYSNAPDTIACLRAIADMSVQPRLIVVVDNHSRDNSVERIMETWDTFSSPLLLRQEKDHSLLLPPGAKHVLVSRVANDGFSAGNNVGIRLALQDKGCKAVWLLNNDTEPTPDALEKLCERLNQRPDAGMAGSTLVYAHDKHTVQCAGGAVCSPWTGATRFFSMGERLFVVRTADPSSIDAKLSYVTGASILIRRDVLQSVGLLPEEYFLYYEDTDFGLLCTRKGFSLTWAPNSIVYHKEGGSTGAESATKWRTFNRPTWVDYLALRNRVYMMRRHYPWALPLVLLSYLGVMLNRIRRGQTNRIPLVFRAAWDGLCGRMGKPDHIFPVLLDTHENLGH
jgi:GT2 family glycosyltransferase